jgi:hypothetical protein
MTNQNARRRYTKNPRYGHKGGLPSVFPFKRRLPGGMVRQCVQWLNMSIGDDEGDGEGIAFAVTKHTQDTEYVLWLSVDAALTLQRSDIISHVEESDG